MKRAQEEWKHDIVYDQKKKIEKKKIKKKSKKKNQKKKLKNKN